MFDGKPPALTFPSLKYSEQDTPYDLRVFLYRGGAAAKRRTGASWINEEKLGAPLLERVPIVSAIHREMESSLVGGGSRLTLVNTYRTLNRFIAWADKEGEQINLGSVRRAFAGWTEFLLRRQRSGQIKAVTVYGNAFQVRAFLDRILDRRRGATLGETRVKFEWNKKRAIGTEADKQNLSDTFAFGHMLLDFTESLTPEAIAGPLPVVIRLRSGNRLELWGRLRRPHLVKILSKPDSSEKREIERVRAMYSADSTLATRYSFVNLRIEAERPHHQVAIVEISRFLSATDPAIASPGPGACIEASPLAVPGTPRTAPQPDCASPAGCLFCAHHRDIDSADHVWSLCSYRYLKTLEIALPRPTKADDGSEHPAMTVVERIDHKLKRFQASSEVRNLWVREAHARVAEGTHHPRWDGFIELAELK